MFRLDEEPLKISVCTHVSLCTKHTIRAPFNHVNFTLL